MKKQRKFCQHPFCGRLTEDGANYCTKHKPQPKPRVKKAYEKWYDLKAWQTIRKQQLTNEPLCRECNKAGIQTKATEVDHIQPHIGDFKQFIDRTNLQSLCKQCHSKKTWHENNR